MKALILAAGKGDRLKDLTGDLPKALVPVLGKELLSYQLSFLKDSPATQVGLVGGYFGSLVKDFILEKRPDVEFFNNPNFHQGSILSLQCALDFLDDDFLLMNVDHIYPKRLWRRFQPGKEITIFCDFDRPLVADDMKIERNAQGTLKAIHKKLEKYDGGYIGMTFCPRLKIQNYLKGLTKTLEKSGMKSSVELILGELAKSGEIIHIVDTSGVRWLEVDNGEDLERAERVLKENRDFLK